MADEQTHVLVAVDSVRSRKHAITHTCVVFASTGNIPRGGTVGAEWGSRSPCAETAKNAPLLRESADSATTYG